MAKKRPKKKKSMKFTAKTANKHDLYELSVQDTEPDIRFVQRVFRKERGRAPTKLREDFCGTAKLCADWVAKHPERRAVGLDLHIPTMRYGEKKHLAPLGDAAKRVQLLERNVLDGTSDRFDVIVGFNFSYSIFKERKDLLNYFRVAHRDLESDGAFMIDLYGGPEAQIITEESTRMKGFTYVWEQMPIDVVSGFGKRYIHFRFPDGSELKRAFTYDWRLWSLPELRDLMLAAGFKAADVYWEGTDENGEGNGVFRKVRRAENEDAWIAYLVGWR